MLLQRQLSSIPPEANTSSSSDQEIRQEAVSTSDRMDLKGKSPVGGQEINLEPSSSGCFPPSLRGHDLASLLQEQDLVSSRVLEEPNNLARDDILDDESEDSSRRSDQAVSWSCNDFQLLLYCKLTPPCNETSKTHSWCMIRTRSKHFAAHSSGDLSSQTPSMSRCVLQLSEYKTLEYHHHLLCSTG